MEGVLRQGRSCASQTIAYEVYHDGRSHLYYDQLPPEILARRDTVLFWIDHAQPEMRSRGQPVEKSRWLQPMAEELLRFLCQLQLAGQEVKLMDAFKVVSQGDRSFDAGSVSNNVGVHQNAINLFAREPFIIKRSTGSRPSAEKILRFHGQGTYRVGERAFTQLCIIRRIPSQ